MSTPVRIRLRYTDVDTFVDKFAPNVTRGGVFLASRAIQPVGSVIPFEVQLVSGEVILSGRGKVSWVKEFNPAEPGRPYGMGVQFVSVDPASRPVLARILRAKEASGPHDRRVTGAHVPLASRQTTAPLPLLNGRPGVFAPTVDTSVDLVAEYGLDELTVRRVMERAWMLGARADDDLVDLLRPEPAETITLIQALADLPRLLDPRSSRRRTTLAMRPLGPGVAPAIELVGTTGELGPLGSTLGAVSTPPAANSNGPASTEASPEGVTVGAAVSSAAADPAAGPTAADPAEITNNESGRTTSELAAADEPGSGPTRTGRGKKRRR